MKSKSEISAFIIFLVLSTLLLIYILIPLFSSIFWAVVISLTFIPAHKKICRTLPLHKNICAGLSTVACILCVILPVLFIVIVSIAELKDQVEKVVLSENGLQDLLKKYFNSIPYLEDGLRRVGVSESQALKKIEETSKDIGKSIASIAVPAGQNIFSFVLKFALMSYLIFFLFRDGSRIIRLLVSALPLSKDKCDILIDKIYSVVQATIRGNFVVAAIQGILGGVLFFAIGVPGAFLLGTLMAFVALIPVAGSALVWFPLGVFMLINGQYVSGLIVILFGTLVISVVDNILRPILVGKDTRLPDYVILFTTIGGITVMGTEGFVAGPLIAALVTVFWGFFIDEFNRPETRL